MIVLPQSAAATLHHAGRTWYFCGQGCAKKFNATPAAYDGSTLLPQPAIASRSSSEYTCPPCIRRLCNTDVAMESGGIILVKGDLRGIVKARRLSQRTMGNIRQNLFFAFAYTPSAYPLRPASCTRCLACS